MGVVGREAVAKVLEPAAERAPREQDHLEIGVGRGGVPADDLGEKVATGNELAWSRTTGAGKDELAKALRVRDIRHDRAVALVGECCGFLK